MWVYNSVLLLYFRIFYACSFSNISWALLKHAVPKQANLFSKILVLSIPSKSHKLSDIPFQKRSKPAIVDARGLTLPLPCTRIARYARLPCIHKTPTY